MRLSKKKIDKQIQGEIFENLYQVVADLQNPRETKLFLKDILTEAELTALVKRLAIAQYLGTGRNYASIKEALGVSSATIATIEEKLQTSPGLSLALKKIEAEKWASGWTGKIEKLLGKNNGRGTA